MDFAYYNPSDEKRSCVVRTMTKLTGKDYQTVRQELTALAEETGYPDYNEPAVFEQYLAEHDYFRCMDDCGVQVKEYLGEDTFKGVVIEDGNGMRISYDLDGLFVAIGLVPQNEAFADVVSLNAYGYADVNEFCRTETPGIFVAGDCRSKRIRQVTTAASDGAVAALAACDYADGRG